MEVIGNPYGAFRSLPEDVREQACSCPHWKSGFTRVPRMNIWVHNLCGKPTPFVLLRLAEECYECERIYVPHEFPDRFKLCPKCS